jgi:hypothetical protein
MLKKIERGSQFFFQKPSKPLPSFARQFITFSKINPCLFKNNPYVSKINRTISKGKFEDSVC